MVAIQYYKSPVGEMIIGSYGDKICLCDWRHQKHRSTIDARLRKGLGTDFVEAQSEVIARAVAQLDEYFAGHRREFDLPLLMVGTDFQRSVWNALLEVEYGKSQSYLGLATQINNPRAVRAAASATGANAMAIIVPCHRIIGSNGQLVSFAGGLTAKAKLLELESKLDLFSDQK